MLTESLSAFQAGAICSTHVPTEAEKSGHGRRTGERHRAGGVRAIGRDNIDGWLSRHLRTRLGIDLARIVFRSGRIAAVYGAALSDGRQVAIKVHRRAADLARLRAATACQRQLADAGYPCPAPLDGPATTDGLAAVIETLLHDSEPGNGHEPSTRRAMARGLVEQLELLRVAAVDSLLAGAPAWSHYKQGPWPKPHDPIFDFTVTPQAFTWLDELARQAASVLQQAGPPDTIAHADWNCGSGPSKTTRAVRPVGPVVPSE